MTLEETNELYEFLQGVTPEGYDLKHQPKLSKLKAFTVIYILQEKFGVIPCNFERCVACGDIFDTEQEGQYVERTGSHYCDCQWGIERR